MSPSLLNLDPALVPHEIKFLVSGALAARIRGWAIEFMQLDAHAARELGGAYEVQSLYLDTPGFDVFHRRGSFGRGKYRVRRYLPSGTIFLERKMKAKGVVRKRRSETDGADLHRLSNGFDGNWPGLWYQRRLRLRNLQPVCQISYVRTAFVASSSGHSPARLTIDQQIYARPAAGFLFDDERGDAVILPEHSILELKFAGQTPGLFKRLADEFGLNAQPVSKYRLAVPALGLAKAEPASQAVATG